MQENNKSQAEKHIWYKIDYKSLPPFKWPKRKWLDFVKAKLQ